MKKQQEANLLKQLSFQSNKLQQKQFTNNHVHHRARSQQTMFATDPLRTMSVMNRSVTNVVCYEQFCFEMEK